MDFIYYRNRALFAIIAEILCGILIFYCHFYFKWDKNSIYIITEFIVCFSVGVVVFSIFCIRITSSSSKFFSLIGLTFVIFSIYSIIMLFAMIYKSIGLIDTLHPSINEAQSASSLAVYFSITTFTTVGFGDVVPSPDCRFFAAAEALLNYILMAVLVASAVSFTRRFALSPKEIEKFFPNEDSLSPEN